MTNLRMGVVLQHLRRLTAQQHDNELPDGQLLERFALQRDESAFAALLRRHGPMVLGVCRGILRNAHDVEDAFQATFLILAQKASSIRQRESVGGWLHEVAAHVALKASAHAAQRQRVERREPDRTESDPLDDLTVRELRQALHEELRRLPEKYRTPLVLCYLEGKTQEEAARQLGWPKRRVKDRLQQGRERLRRRLSQRGLAPAALGTALFAVDSVAATVPATLAGATLRSALNAAPLAPAVAALVQAGGAMLTASKAKVVVALVLAVSLLSGAGVWACRSWIAAAVASPVEPPAATADDRPKAASPKPETAKTVEIQGRVLGPDGKPKAGAKLRLLGLDKKIVELGVTAADGRFSVSVPKEATDHQLIAQADDTGFAFLWASGLKTEKPVELHLVKEQSIRGRVVNTEGKPVVGLRVTASAINIYPNNSVDCFLAYWKNRLVGENPLFGGGSGNAADALFAATTDAEGRFVLRGIGVERFVPLRLRGAGIAEVELWIVTRPAFDPKPFNKAILDNSPKDTEGVFRPLHGPDVTVVAEPEKILRGVVKDADTGTGRANILVHLFQLGGLEHQARTDANGRYEIRNARKAKSYQLEVPSDPETGYVGCQVQAEDTPGYQPVAADIKVKKGVIITGRMIDQETGKPVNGYLRVAVLFDNPFVKEYPGFDSAAWDSVGVTDANGVFRLVAIPGPILLMGGLRVTDAEFKYKPSVVEPKYRRYFRAEPNSRAFFRPGGGFSPIMGSYFKVLEIKPDAKLVEQDIVLERLPAMTIQIQDGDGKPLTNVYVAGLTAEGHYPSWDDKGRCSAYGIQSGKPRLMIFFHPKGKLASAITLKGDEKQPVVVKLGPAGALKGRLLDADGEPLASIRIDLHYHNLDARGMHRCIHEEKQIETDAQGAFAFDDVLPGFKFGLSFRRGKQRFERETKSVDSTIQIKPGECRDLGAIPLKPISQKYNE